MPKEVGMVVGALGVAIVLICAVLIFNAFNESSTVQNLPESSKEQIKDVQNNFWAGVALIGIAGTIGLVGAFYAFAKRF